MDCCHAAAMTMGKRGLDSRSPGRKASMSDSSNVALDRFVQASRVARSGQSLVVPEPDHEVVLKAREAGMAVHTAIFDGHHRPFTAEDLLCRRQRDSVA